MAAQESYLKAQAGKSEAEKQKEEAEAAKAVADLEKAKVDADAAAQEKALNAKFGELEKLAGLDVSAGTAGEVTVADSGAGKIEANLLAANALNKIAGNICEDVHAALETVADTSARNCENCKNCDCDCDDCKCVCTRPADSHNVFIRKASDPKPETLNALYNLQVQLLAAQIAAFDPLYAEFERRVKDVKDSRSRESVWFYGGEVSEDPEGGIRTDAIAKLATDIVGLGVVAEATGALLNVFKTDFAVGDITLANSHGALIATVAGCMSEADNVKAYTAASLAAGHDHNQILQTVSQERAKLVAISQQANAIVEIKAFYVKEIAAQTASQSPDAAYKAALEKAVQAADAALAAAKAAGDAYVDFVKALGSGTSGLSVGGVMDALVYESIAPEIVLEVAVEAQGGSYYTKKNIWSSLGAMPFELAGGAVARYTLYDAKSAGLILSSGVAGSHSGYFDVDDIARISSVPFSTDAVSAAPDCETRRRYGRPRC